MENNGAICWANTFVEWNKSKIWSLLLGKNKDEGSAEVDFCFQYKDKIVAIEVKSGATKEMKSLFSMIDTGGDTILR